jgi:hypothetical protein
MVGSVILKAGSRTEFMPPGIRPEISVHTKFTLVFNGGAAAAKLIGIFEPAFDTVEDALTTTVGMSSRTTTTSAALEATRWSPEFETSTRKKNLEPNNSAIVLGSCKVLAGNDKIEWFPDRWGSNSLFPEESRQGPFS